MSCVYVLYISKEYCCVVCIFIYSSQHSTLLLHAKYFPLKSILYTLSFGEFMGSHSFKLYLLVHKFYLVPFSQSLLVMG